MEIEERLSWEKSDGRQRRHLDPVNKDLISSPCFGPSRRKKYSSLLPCDTYVRLLLSFLSLIIRSNIINYAQWEGMEQEEDEREKLLERTTFNEGREKQSIAQRERERERERERAI